MLVQVRPGAVFQMVEVSLIIANRGRMRESQRCGSAMYIVPRDHLYTVKAEHPVTYRRH